MSIHEDFLRFIAWAGKEGFDVAHSVGDGKYICLSPQTAELWKAWKASKYTPSSNVEGKEAARELVRAACLQERQPTEAHQRAYRAAWDELMRRLTPQREWDEFGRTNSGDETGGTVQRFGFDISRPKPEIIPATCGAFVYYSDYLALHQKLAAQAAPAPEPTSDETLTWEKPPSAIEGRLGVWLTSGAELHPRTVNLVVRFARALASKLAAAEAKYGYSDGWASPDWMDECRAKLMEHIAKGDPRDVAAYCAFLWHHGASTARPEPSAQGRPCPFGCTTQEEHDAHQSAEPSAQGEPVAWRPGDPIYDDAYVRGVAVGFAEDDSRRTTLLRIADRIEARASAPSTPPHAVVEAVPLNFDQLQSVMSQHFGGRELTDDEADSAEAFARAIERAHGIAPKAAQGEPVAHLGLTETQLMRGNASTSAPSTQPLAALFDLAAVLTGPDGKVAIHGSDGDMRIIDNALQTLRTSIINWTKS